MARSPIITITRILTRDGAIRTNTLTGSHIRVIAAPYRTIARRAGARMWARIARRNRPAPLTVLAHTAIILNPVRTMGDIRARGAHRVMRLAYGTSAQSRVVSGRTVRWAHPCMRPIMVLSRAQTAHMVAVRYV